jgi:aromatic-amino-acid transaminase
LNTITAPHSPSLLDGVAMAPADPILGVTEAFVADPNPKKVNLGVGVYTDDSGKIPLLECVRRAEELRLKTSPHRGYLPIDGLALYDGAVQALVFGKEEKRIVTVQALGGTGGLKIGADFLKQFAPKASVWISEPSWENHRQLFETAGFAVKAYAYYDPATKGLDFAGMKRALESPAATTLPAWICRRTTGTPSSTSCARAS